MPLIQPENYFSRVWHDGPCRGPMRKDRTDTITIEDGSTLPRWDCMGCGASLYAGLDAQRFVVRRPVSPDDPGPVVAQDEDRVEGVAEDGQTDASVRDPGQDRVENGAEVGADELIDMVRRYGSAATRYGAGGDDDLQEAGKLEREIIDRIRALSRAAQEPGGERDVAWIEGLRFARDTDDGDGFVLHPDGRGNRMDIKVYLRTALPDTPTDSEEDDDGR